MAYEGYLVKVGSTSGNIDHEIPLQFIKADTYSVVWSTTDVDSFRNAEGTLVRNTVLPNKVMKVEFETPDISNTDFETEMAKIRARYVNSTEKSIYVKAWVPELGVYKTDKCYLPDINVSIRFANNSKIRYNPIRLAFIGYSTTGAT